MDRLILGSTGGLTHGLPSEVSASRNASLADLIRVFNASNAAQSRPYSHVDCSLFAFILYVGVFGLMCVFGLIGNTVSYVVLSSERHSHVATFLLRVSHSLQGSFTNLVTFYRHCY